MDDVTSFSRKMSDLLDGIGLSSDEIDWRRKIWSYWEFLTNSSNLVRGRDKTAYVTGSRAEGVGLDILGSDLDVMSCSEIYRVIYCATEWELKLDMRTLLVDTSGVHVGYCRLKAMNPDEPTFPDSTYQIPLLTVHNGDVVLNHKTKDNLQFIRRQGPAKTTQVKSSPTTGEMDFDQVACVRLPWPPAAREWLRRARCSNFPPEQTIHSAERNGAFLVATGYKASSHPEIEFRFSFSLLELELMHLWPNTALKCYATLKLVCKQLKEQPPSSRTLSSYHLKTLMFWLIEETGVKFWNETPLLECLRFCLTRLLIYIQDGCMPHYFLKENNLFEAWAGTTEQDHLIRTFRAMFSEGPQIISHNKIWQQFWSSCKEARLDNSCNRHERFSCLLSFSGNVHISLIELRKHVFSKDTRVLLANIDDVICRLMALHVPNDYNLSSAVSYIMNDMKSSRGLYILSFILRNKALLSNRTVYSLFKLAQGSLEKSIGYRNEHLKLAIFYYQVGKYQSALEVLQKLADSNDHRLVKIGIFQQENFSSEQIDNLVSINSPFDAFVKFVSTEFVFSKAEIYVTPPALKHEMFKMGGPPTDVINLVKEFYQEDAVVDPDVLFYYLQYICYRHVGSESNARVALDNLEWITTDSQVLCRETAFNVLGYCQLERGMVRRSVNSFVKSLWIEPRFTAAPSHLAVVIGKSIRPDSL